MSATGTARWLEANQRYVAACIARVAQHVEIYVRRIGGKSPVAAAAAPDPAAAETELASPPLDALCDMFGLTSFERDLLLLCAGFELDGRIGELCAAVQGERRKNAVTFGLALEALPEPHWSALAPVAPLRRWRLVDVGSAESLVTAPLRIDERVLHYIVGVSYLDDRLDGLMTAVVGSETLPASHARIVDEIAHAWSRAAAPVIQLCGADDGAKAAIATAACERIGVGLWRVRAADIPQAPGERSSFAHLAERELALSNAALLLTIEPESGGTAERAVVALAEAMSALTIIATPEPFPIEARPRVRLEVEKPTAEERSALWRDALGSIAARLDGQIEMLADQFHLDTGGIRAARTAIERDAANGDGIGTRLWDACRAQARRRLDGLAQRIEAIAHWDDLVLPEPQRDTLREIALHVRRSRMVHETWGFAAKSHRGLGISALFAGASGTGKTMAAEVVANELRLDLYRVDLSQVVSKYIGETEKNMKRIFDAAEESGTILLFDEADALFGKRSEVKDSHDRYANIEVSYLLQRMEAYRGLAILTTNMKSALDQAFLRRIRFVVQFPFPDLPQRQEIWARVFPPATPRHDLDFARLARLNLAGGNIRNIALNASFLAAESGEPVSMPHVLRAVQSEYAKLEKPLSATELGGRP